MNYDKLVIVLNGKPRAGKDTFAEILGRYMRVYKYSAVTKVKAIAMLCGWDGKKDEPDRKFLSDLKVLTSEYSDMSFNDVVRKIEAFKRGEVEADVFVVDIREPEEIKRMVEATGAITVFIKNDRVPAVTSNMADANVENYDYDFVITNNGTLEEFEDEIKLFFEFLMMASLMSDND